MTTSSEQAGVILDRLDEKYEITVVFTRYLDEDLIHVESSPERFDEALVKQFVGEMQEAVEQYGIPAGFFKVSDITFWGKGNDRRHKFIVEDQADGDFSLIEM